MMKADKKRTTKAFLFLTTFFLVVIMHVGFVAPVAAGDELSNLLEQKLNQAVDGNINITRDFKTGYVRFIRAIGGFSFPQPYNNVYSLDAEATARNFLAEYGTLFGLNNRVEEIQILSEKSASNNRAIVKFQQVYKGIPVFAGEIIVRMNAIFQVMSANGELSSALSVDTTAIVTSFEAQEKALALVSGNYETPASSLAVRDPELNIYNPALIGEGENKNYLVWRMEVTSSIQPIRELVMVDAHTGEIVLNFNQINDAKDRKTYDNQNNPSHGLPGNGPVRSEGQGPHAVKEVNNAHNYAGDTYDFYWNHHHRDSIDNAGMTIVSTVRFCWDTTNCPYHNAFWNGSQMVYGDGFATADDVVAHELTHGVTGHESKLVYKNESGAINESFSDVWGEFVDLTNSSGTDTAAVRWLMGEDLPGIGAIRDMADPTAFNDPDKITSSYYYCGTKDNGGVHTNSGVNNKAAYLMVDGGIFNGKNVTGIGISKTAAIYYEAQTNILTSGSNFRDLYNALQTACSALIGSDGITSADCAEVKNALDAVEMNTPACSSIVPGKATLISPKGTIDDNTPTYTWNAVSDATWYYLWVNDSSGNRIKKWYRSVDVCTGSTCSATLTTQLKYGKWWIQTWNKNGYGPWSNALSFIVEGPEPGRATLYSPSGKITDRTPTYTWRRGDDATWYYLWVNDSSGNRIKKWYKSADICSGSTCSVTPTTQLKSGKWWIRTWNPYGYGPWSFPLTFTVVGFEPDKITLISPKGNITDSTPTYTWKAASDATWYRLWVNDPSGNRIKKWYTADSVCSGLTCSVTPSTQLKDGAGKWWIQMWNATGYGPWSDSANFNLSASGGGFNSQFKGEAANWKHLASSPPWFFNNEYLYTDGKAGKFASTYYGSYSDTNTMYANYEYEVKLWRKGSDSPSNGILFRGNPNPPGSSGDWHHGYSFDYSRSGYFSIWKMTGGSAAALKGWTASSAIHKGAAWNVLRVRAYGSTMAFYINGSHVATVTNSSYSTGKVGIEMSRGSAAGRLWADYAKLTPISTAMGGDVESATDADAVVIDEAVVMEQGGEYSDGDHTGVGHYLLQDDSAETEPVQTPEGLTSPGPIPEVQVKSIN